MNTKNLSLAVIAALVVAGGAFFGGIKYSESHGAVSPASFQNMTPDQRQQLMQQFRNNGGARASGMPGRGGQNGGGFTNGQVIAKDDKSVTVKLRDGGSKIVFFSDKTQILKSASGTMDDVANGEQVMVSGTANPDGSITAESIQVRPQLPQDQNQQPQSSPAQNQ